MEDMEVNAGTIADGTETFEDVGKLIFEYVLALASGSKTYRRRSVTRWSIFGTKA